MLSAEIPNLLFLGAIRMINSIQSTLHEATVLYLVGWLAIGMVGLE
jgi:hypothetical protein